MLCKKAYVSRAWQGHCGCSLKWSRGESIYTMEIGKDINQSFFYFVFCVAVGCWPVTPVPTVGGNLPFQMKESQCVSRVWGYKEKMAQDEKWTENTHKGPCMPFGGPIIILCTTGGWWWSLKKVMSWLNFDSRNDLTIVKKMDERDTIMGWEEVAERAVSKL